MTKNVINGSCLAQPLETQASDSTGFRSFKQIIVELDQSITAYNKIVVEDPITRCLFVGSMVKWACLINSQLLDYLDKIDKGKLVEVLNVDFIKFSSLDYWLSGRIKYDMMAYQDIPLNLKASDFEYSSSLEIYKAYEAIVSEMAVNFNKVKDTFEHLELYKPVIQQMKEQYSDPLISYEYAQMKEMYIDPTLEDYLQMQVTTCIDLLRSGILNDVLSIRNEEVEAVDEAELYKMIDSDYETPPNLKKLWAKLKKFIEKKEDYLIVPNRDKLLKYVLKHKDILTVDHIRAVFKFDNVMMLIHQDMVKMKPELAQYLTTNESPNVFGIVNSLTRLMQQDWFKEFRTDPKYGDIWIEKFVSELLASEYQQELLEIWKDADKRLTLKGNIIGCLNKAGIIDGSDLGIATALLNGTIGENKKFAIYMGRGKKMVFCDWICDYVKG